MRPRKPTVAANWLLDRFHPGLNREALAGDLLEQFDGGRSIGWYWRQVLQALLIAQTRSLVDLCGASSFAVFWSILAPVWLFGIFHLEQLLRLDQRLAEMLWPWCELCAYGLMLSANLLFLWAGVLLYLSAQRGFQRDLISRTIHSSFPILAALWAILLLLSKLLVGEFQRLSPLQAFFDPRPQALALRIVFFLLLAGTLWQERRLRTRRPNRFAV